MRPSPRTKRIAGELLLPAIAVVAVAAGLFLAWLGLEKADQLGGTVALLVLVTAGLLTLRRHWLQIPGQMAGVPLPADARQEAALAGFRFTKDGRLPRVEEVDPVELGVKPAIVVGDRAHHPLPPYVERDRDEDLAWALQAGGLVLVHGRSAVGKTRTAAQAIRTLDQRVLLIPVRHQALRELVLSGFPVENAVIWLDDAEQCLGEADLDVALLDALCPPQRTDVVIVATIRDEERIRFDPALATDSYSQQQIHRPVAEVLRSARSTIELKRDLSPTEIDAARQHRADERIDEALDHPDVGFTEYLAAGPQLFRRWREGPTDHHGPGAVGAAIISASVDCRRAGYNRPVPSDRINELHAEYLPDALRHHPDVCAFSDGLAWARQPICGASGCLTPHQDATYLAFDYLVDRAPKDLKVPEKIWHTVLDLATVVECFAIGSAAYRLGRRDVAIQAWRRVAAAGHVDAMNELAVLLAEQGDVQEAEQWLRRPAKFGATAAMYNLAALLAERGDVQEAEQWYRRAAVDSDGGVMPVFDRDTGKVHVYRRPPDRGRPEAMHKLAVLLAERGDVQEAEQWYRHAADAGNATAMHNLRKLLDGQPKAGNAEQ